MTMSSLAGASGRETIVTRAAILRSRALGRASAVMICVAALGCGDDGEAEPERAAAMNDTASAAETPPRGASAVEAWLATGAYKSWRCEPTVHAARSPSPHGYNRICSNAVLAKAAPGTAAWPRGAAAVKELYNAPNETTPSGYSVYLKVQDDSAGGAGWYWYERLPGDSGAIADGLGSEQAPKTFCVSCHVAAGADPAHTPSLYGRDQVYTPVL